MFFASICANQLKIRADLQCWRMDFESNSLKPVGRRMRWCMNYKFNEFETSDGIDQNLKQLGATER